MKTRLVITNIIYSLLLFVLMATQVGCGKVEFLRKSNQKGTDPLATTNATDPNDPNNPNDSNNSNTPSDLLETVFIDDSFERDDINFDVVNNVFYGWRGFVQDGATNVLAYQSNGAGSRIPPAADVGPAADGLRALYMNGRENGSAVETIHLISQSFDLSLYNTAILNFRYLTFNLNDPDDQQSEWLELQVCRGTLNDCGANDDGINAGGLTSANWVTVFSSANQAFNDDNFNGKNHAATDWQTGLALIDLNDPNFVGDSSTFVFRFVSRMRDGLAGEICTENPGPRDVDFLKDILGTDLEKRFFERFACGEDGQGNHGHDKYKHDSKDRKYSSVDGYKKYHTAKYGSDHKHDRGHKGDRSCHGHHDKPKKVKICHIPKGNPENAETLCVARESLKAHSQHGNDKVSDYFGKCRDGGGSTCTPPDGTFKDGVAIDKVHGLATEKFIQDIL